MEKLTDTDEYTDFIVSDFSRESEYKPKKRAFESIIKLLKTYSEEEVFESFFSEIDPAMNLSESEVIYLRQLAKAGLSGAQKIVRKFRNGLFDLNEGELHNSIALTGTGDSSSIKKVIKSYIKREDIRNVIKFFSDLHHENQHWRIVREVIFLNDMTNFHDIFSSISVTVATNGNCGHDPMIVMGLKQYLEEVSENSFQLLLDCYIDIEEADPFLYYLDFSLLNLKKPLAYLDKIFKKTNDDEWHKFTIALHLVRNGDKGSMNFLKRLDFCSSQKETVSKHLKIFPDNRHLQALDIG